MVLSSDWKIYTLEDLDSERAFESLAIYPVGGMILQPISRSAGNEIGLKNNWIQVGWGGELSSFDIFDRYMLEDTPFFRAWVLEYVSFGH